MLKGDFPKIWDYMKKRGLEALILSDPDNICYITGYANQTDNSFPYKGCPTTVIILKGKEPGVILPGMEEESFKELSWVEKISIYTNYDYKNQLDIGKNALQANISALKDSGLSKGKVGYEPLYMPQYIHGGLSKYFPHFDWKDITGEIATLRAVKTIDEIEAIRKAAKLGNIGQKKVGELVKPGKSEIEIFNETRKSMETAAGQRLQIAGDLVTGERCGLGGEGLPLDTILEDGDLLVSDIIPRLNGWWADSCNTFAVGKPSAFHKKIYRIVIEALEIGIKKARPGIKACDLDAAVRGYIEKNGYKYEHHTGHGVGVAQAESPWIVPYNKEELKEGMVITLEPAIYPGGKGSVRIEGLFIVTKDHLEPLTNYNRQLES